MKDYRFSLSAEAFYRKPELNDTFSNVRSSTITLFLFGIYLLGAHLRLSLYSGNAILIPMYLMVISGFFVAFLSLRAIFSAMGFPILLLAMFLLLQPALSAIFGARQDISITSSIQLFVSVVIALAFLMALSKVDPVRIRRLLFFFWVSLVLLALLESLGLRPAFEVLRDILYTGSERGLYVSDLRDMEIYGSVRPTVFASEPSFLADSVYSLAILMFMLDHRRKRLTGQLRFGVMLLVCALITPSFKLVFYVFAVFLWLYWPRNARTQLFVAFTLPIIALCLWVASPVLLPIIESVAGQHSETGSFYGRVEVGPFVAAGALIISPFFGFGLGGADEVYPIISSIWINSGAFQSFPWYMDVGARELMSNGFWWQWIFLGAGGGLIFIVLLLRIMSRFSIDMPMRSLVCTWVVWYGGSAFVDPHSWYMLIIFSLGSMRNFTFLSERPIQLS